MAAKRSRPGPASGSPEPTDPKGNLSVLVELRHQVGGAGAFAMGMAREFKLPGFALDEQFEPVALPVSGEGLAVTTDTYVVRGTARSEDEIDALRARPEVAGVWRDTPIAPFPARSSLGLSEPLVQPVPSPAMAPCPIPPCDCSPQTPKGTIADVAAYLGVDRIWTAGFRGSGILVGVVDSGITAQGRPVKAGETARRIARVIGGWPTDDWGTESSKWGDHGNMCATDVLGMAPEAQLYDLRVAGAGGSPGTISRALQAFQWAITRHRTNGTPQVLTNSWGIFQESWDTTYARNPNHPFTRKVVEAINEGILVLFAAGNCGDSCPDGRCGTDVGQGKSIWGANGHPMVMTVGAVNKNEEFIGYSSRGPAALDPNKPDFCSISHFTGYFNSDSGTSAATPILAGVVALLKQAKSGATQDEIKNVLKATAKDIGPSGFDIHSGAGIVQAHAAFVQLALPIRPTFEVGCLNTVRPPCRPTVFPPCRTIPPCRPTFEPGCRTLRPPCQPTVFPPCRRTLPPICRPTVTLDCRTFAPPCPRPTLDPSCRTLGPQCPRPTLIAPNCDRRTLGPPCPRPTLGPPCPRPTLGPPCPRPTLGPECVARPGVPGGLEAGAGGWGWDPWSDSGGYPEGDWGGYDQPWPTCDDSGYGDPWESGWSWPGECWSDDGSGWDPGGWGRG